MIRFPNSPPTDKEVLTLMLAVEEQSHEPTEQIRLVRDRRLVNGCMVMTAEESGEEWKEGYE